MQEATCVLDQDTPPLGYLLCTAAQEGFYAKCGWSTIDNVAIRPTANQPCRPLDEHERCLMHDPMGVLHGSIVLTGTVF